MALIKCPECGSEISDKAKMCPRCGCPVEEMNPNRPVMIKLCTLKAPTGLNGDQKVSIIWEGQTIWVGTAGQVVELIFEQPTTITVKYHLSLMHYGGECTGIIDPFKSKKYCVVARQGMMSTKLVLQPVDLFDAD